MAVWRLHPPRLASQPPPLPHFGRLRTASNRFEPLRHPIKRGCSAGHLAPQGSPCRAPPVVAARQSSPQPAVGSSLVASLCIWTLTEVSALASREPVLGVTSAPFGASLLGGSRRLGGAGGGGPGAGAVRPCSRPGPALRCPPPEVNDGVRRGIPIRRHNFFIKKKSHIGSGF